jgi:hypothetical protein
MKAIEIRALRAPKEPVDPRRPLGWLREEERAAGGGTEPALTVFLAGAECPFTCVFCDLWRRTLDHATPPGAIPTQLAIALAGAAAADPGAPPFHRIKLYNASNFFDPRAVPLEDDPAIAAVLAPFPRVTVECHPRLVGRRCLDFARRLAGSLEVAMGLETVHPEALPRLGKEMTLADFDRAAAALVAAKIPIRAFVLVGVPHVPPGEQAEWAAAAARHAFAQGAERVALIPVRGGNGALEALAARGEWTPPRLADLEAALDAALVLDMGIVEADLWDAERLVTCAACGERRLARLRRINRSGTSEPGVACGAYGDQKR